LCHNEWGLRKEDPLTLPGDQDLNFLRLRDRSIHRPEAAS